MVWQALENMKQLRRRLASLFQKEKQKLATESNILKSREAMPATLANLSKLLCDTPSSTVALNGFCNGFT